MQGNKTKREKTNENSMEKCKEICRETTGHFRIKRETWWWNGKIQQETREIDREAYKQKRKETKVQ